MERVSIPVSVCFDDNKPVNSSFTQYRCRILALGKNQNGSYFSKDAVSDAVDKFKNLPIIAYVYDGDDGKKHIAGHEMKLVERDGEHKWETKCVPYGVIPADADFEFEDVAEDNGVVSTYLTTSAILWTRKYPDIIEAAYEGDKSYAASMEIQVDSMRRLENDERYYEILSFTPDALTLLGKSDDPDYNVLPCFPSAGLVPYSLNEQFSILMDEFKVALAECFTKIDGGEQEAMDQEITKDVDVIEEPEKVFEEQQQEEVENEEQEQEVFEESQEPKLPKLFVLNSQKRDAIAKAVKEKEVYDDDDMYIFYYLVDFDDKYAYVERNKYVGEDYEHAVGRFAYNIAEGENLVVVEIVGEFEEMYMRWLTKEELDAVESMEREYAAYKESHSAENTEVEELRKFKAERLEADRKAAVAAVVEQFSDLEGNADFEELKKSAVDIDVTDFEEKCFALRGKTMKPKAKAVVRMPIIKDGNDCNEPYGGAFSVYGHKRGE